MKGQLDEIIRFIYDSDYLEKDEIKKVITDRIKIRSDIQLRLSEYLLKIRDNSTRFNGLIQQTINELLIDHKEEVRNKEKFISSKDLSKVLGLTNGRVNQLIKEGKIKNIDQKDKNYKIFIPFNEVDYFVEHQQKYLNKWNTYKTEYK